jgi:hypothetical protein
MRYEFAMDEDVIKKARMEGYDIARWRLRKYLVGLAMSHPRSRRNLEHASEYIGVIMADYTGEPGEMGPPLPLPKGDGE